MRPVAQAAASVTVFGTRPLAKPGGDRFGY
jgi:hypothetical protein